MRTTAGLLATALLVLGTAVDAAASTYNTSTCRTASRSGTATTTTRLSSSTLTSTSYTTRQPTLTLTTTTTLPPSTATRRVTATLAAGATVTGAPATSTATSTVYTATVTSSSSYIDTRYSYQPTTLTAISTTRAYTYILDAPLPALPASSSTATPTRRALSLSTLQRRGRIVQCTPLRLVVSTRTGTSTQTTTLTRTTQTTRTITLTTTRTVPTITLTPYPVTTTLTTSDVMTWVNYVAITDPPPPTQTVYYTVTAYTATTTTTAPAYKPCATGAGMGNQVASIVNTTSRWQMETLVGQISNYDGSYRVDCCNLAAAQPGAISWRFDSGSCYALTLYGAANAASLTNMCKQGWNGTTVEYLAGDGVSGHGKGGLLQCGAAMKQYWVPRGL